MMVMAPAATDAAFLMSEAPTDPLGLGILLLVVMIICFSL